MTMVPTAPGSVSLAQESFPLEAGMKLQRVMGVVANAVVDRQELKRVHAEGVGVAAATLRGEPATSLRSP